MTGWPALLDAIDEGLASTPPVVVDFSPADHGPLPESLAARARVTLQRMAEAEAVLRQEQAELGRQLVALSAAKSAATAGSDSPVPHFLDTKA